jgi:hypothetical protein
MKTYEEAADALLDDMFGDGPRVPAMRTFMVTVVTDAACNINETLYVDAHSVSCEGDSVQFHVIRVEWVGEVQKLVAYTNRILRPYLDIEDITPTLPSAEAAVTAFLN